MNATWLVLGFLGSCPTVDRGPADDGVTTVTVTEPAQSCAPLDPWAGWTCVSAVSTANDNGVQYQADVRWNRDGLASDGTVVWLRGGNSTDYHRELPLARDAQDSLGADGVRSIEVRFLGAGLKSSPSNGVPNISAVVADLWEWLATEGIAEGLLVHAGSSAGGMHAAAALAHHDLGAVLDGVLLCGGPFWSDLAGTCGETGPLAAADSVRQQVDAWSYADEFGTAPCFDREANPAPSWACRSVLGSEAEAAYPGLRLAVVVGLQDAYRPWIAAEAVAWLEAVTAAAETFDEPAAGHSVWVSADGAGTALARIREMLGDPTTETGEAPKAVAMRAAPNPFRDRVTLPADGCRVYDAAGRVVLALRGAEWDGRDAAGRRVAPGTYFYRSAEGFGRVVLVR